MSVAWYLCPCSWERGRWWRFYFSPIPTRRTRIPPVKLNAKYFLFSFPPANQCDLRLSLTHRRRCCPWQRGKRCRRSSWRTPTRREWDLLKRLDHFDWSRATPWRSTVQWQHLFYFIFPPALRDIRSLTILSMESGRLVHREKDSF